SVGAFLSSLPSVADQTSIVNFNLYDLTPLNTPNASPISVSSITFAMSYTDQDTSMTATPLSPNAFTWNSPSGLTPTTTASPVFDNQPLNTYMAGVTVSNTTGEFTIIQDGRFGVNFTVTITPTVGDPLNFSLDPEMIVGPGNGTEEGSWLPKAPPEPPAVHA
ncbi:MAG TPA: hypothetical protein VMM92_15335, partial [Thermoanaerobaculia bacterium]|nr:hypothetical protein [Thermoanaerobaculia bacterium]